MNEQLANRLRSASNLPSLPAIALQVLELAQKPEVDIAEIARIISKDPALSSKILRTVNSSFYSRSQNVGTISHALVILGLQSVKTLVVSFSLVSHLNKGKRTKSGGFKHIDYWRRSIFAATAARAIAAKLNIVQQEEVFLATLLSDIGMLVLDQVLGEEYGQIHEGLNSHSELLAAESEAVGATHAEVAGMLAEMWKLPVLLSTPIAHHHNPEAVKDSALKKMTELVGLAGRCADVFVDEDAAPAIAEVRKLFHERFKLSEADCDALMADIGKRTREVASLFEINIGSVEEYEAILQRANETLIEITLQTQQQASTLQEQATTLKHENQQLQQKAYTDQLTGLANRGRFDSFLAEQLAAAVKNNAPLALLLLDLDKFKNVNDRYGHPAGDAVLKAVAKILQGSARKTDVLARYGGEELALVAPGIDRINAAVLAETIRRAIAARPISTAKTKIPVTASIGVAIYEPGSLLRAPAHLIKAADLAVYNAKHSGRNCVRVFSPRAAGRAANGVPAPAPASASPVVAEPAPSDVPASATAALHASANDAPSALTGGSVAPQVAPQEGAASPAPTPAAA